MARNALFVSILFFSFGFVGPLYAAEATWPDKDWDTAAPAHSKVRPKELEALYKYAFNRSSEDPKKGIRTDAILIVQDGVIQAEQYYQDRRTGYSFDKDSKHLIWSATKSFANALIGIAVQDGLLKLDTPIAEYLPKFKNKPKVLVKHALEFSTCIDWTETYEGSDLTRSSILAMLYGPGRSDVADWTGDQKLACVPGTRALYNSGDSNLLMAVLKKVYGKEAHDMPWKRLFDRIGMKNVTFEHDASGTYVGSSYMYATARDLARFGHLYLNDGMWKQDQLLPKGWTAYSAKPSPAYVHTTILDQAKDWVVGPNFWSNATVPEKKFPSTWPAAPQDMCVASGHWGQGIFIIPSKKMVIVRLADDRDGSFNTNEFLKLALASIQE